MAFKQNRLNVIAYANGITFWSYVSTNDSIEKIDQDNTYFTAINTLMKCGDVFWITADGRTYQRQVTEITDKTVKLEKLG